MLAYGYEQPVVFTPQLIFDLQSANAALQAMDLYGAILKDDYEKAREDYKDFMKEYGDFYSPSDVDNLTYYNMTRGAMSNLMNRYEGDLLRSPEGRREILMVIDNVDRGAISNMRASADAMREFIKNRDALAAQGKYNRRWDEQYSDMTDPTHWDSSRGVWTRTAPSEFKTLHDLTRDEFEGMKPIELLGVVKGPDGALYIKKGVSKDTAMSALQAVMKKEQSIPGMQMYKDIIREEVKNDPNFASASDDDIEQEVQNRWTLQLAEELAKYLLPSYETSPAYVPPQRKIASSSSSSADNKIEGKYSQSLMYAQGYVSNLLGKSPEDVNEIIDLYDGINKTIAKDGSKNYFNLTGTDITTSAMMMMTGQEDKLYENKLLPLDSSITLYSGKDLSLATASRANGISPRSATYFDNENSYTFSFSKLILAFDENATNSGKTKGNKIRKLVVRPMSRNGYINPTLTNGVTTPFGRVQVIEVEITTDNNGNKTIKEITDKKDLTKTSFVKKKFMGIDFLSADEESDTTIVEELNRNVPMIRLIGAMDLNGNILPSEAAAWVEVDAKLTNGFNSNTGVHTGSVTPNVGK